MSEKKLHVAMLEDDRDDRLLTEEVLSGLGFELKIDFFSSSEELFNALSETKPNLLLVDYNSSPENGIQVLKRLKQSNSFHNIPVAILSDSHLPKYKIECYAAGAASFIIKPASLIETKKKIGSFFTYWTEVAES